MSVQKNAFFILWHQKCLVFVLPCYIASNYSRFCPIMVHYTSERALSISDLRSGIATIINVNIQKWTAGIGNEIINAIIEIEAILRQNCSRDHREIIQDPQIRKILKRLENAVHVLCILADVIAGGQGPAATQEEIQGVVDGEKILDLLMNKLMANFSPSSSGAETE